MENNIPTPISKPQIPEVKDSLVFKKSRFIIVLSYVYIVISILPMLLSFSFRSPAGIVFIIVPFVVLITKNKKVYNTAKIFLILGFIFSIIAPFTVLLALITAFVK